jgi:hypothetical protein
MRIRHWAVVTAALGLFGCGSPQDMTAIESAVVAFHEQQLLGDDVGILREAAADLRDTAPLPEFTRLNDAVRNVAPTCDAPVRDRANANFNRSTSGYFITVHYNRTCAGGPLTETFLFRMTQYQPRLAGYHIGGMALFPPAAATPAAPPAEVPPEEVPAVKPGETMPVNPA